MNRVDDILGPAGLVAQKLTGYEDRPEQLSMARAVENAFAGDHHLIAEAGTGVGKSFAYLAPAIQKALSSGADARPVVISTGTIALQEQLVSKDIPFLRSVMGEEFTAVLAKGRSNYVSLRRLENALKQQDPLLANAREARELARLREWSEETHDGTRSSIPFQPSTDVWEEVASDSRNCMGKQCPNFETRCFYQRAKRRLYNADLLIVNHALLCADLALKAQGVHYLPDYRYLIIDEAHDLERYASEHLGLRVTKLGLQFNLSQIYNARTGKGLLVRYDFLRGAQEALRAARDFGEAFFTEVESWARKQRTLPARVYQAEMFRDELSTALLELALRIQEGKISARTEEEQLEIQSHIDRLREYAASIEAFQRQTLEGQVYWVELSDGPRGNVELRAAPVNVGPVLSEHLFDRCHSVVLTSATLATGPNDFSYVRRRLGVPEDGEAAELQTGSPFNYRENARIVIPDVPEPPKAGSRNPEYEKRIEEEILRAVRNSRGGVFVLFTSYGHMRRAYDALSAQLTFRGFHTLRQGDSLSPRQMIERFRTGERMVLFGVESFWQGVDIPGEALTTVVLVRLPFPVPTDPLVAARMDAVRQEGKSDFAHFMVPEATIKLRQGFGRLIRRRDDFGTVVILDSRILHKAYGKKMLAALPPCPVLDEQGRELRPAPSPSL